MEQPVGEGVDSIGGQTDAAVMVGEQVLDRRRQLPGAHYLRKELESGNQGIVFFSSADERSHRGSPEPTGKTARAGADVDLEAVGLRVAAGPAERIVVGPGAVRDTIEQRAVDFDDVWFQESGQAFHGQDSSSVGTTSL